jgi:hypothetical protein
MMTREELTELLCMAEMATCAAFLSHRSSLAWKSHQREAYILRKAVAELKASTAKSDNAAGKPETARRSRHARPYPASPNAILPYRDPEAARAEQDAFYNLCMLSCPIWPPEERT